MRPWNAGRSVVLMPPDTRITVGPVDFYRLLATFQKATIAELEAKAAVERAKLARAVFDAKFTEAGTTYAFDATRSYRFDEETCQLIPVDGSG